MQMGRTFLNGRWKIIRKIRLVRFLRKIISEGVIVRGVREIYEEGCRILSEMERGRGEGSKELEGEEEEGREEYMCELYLLRVGGEQKRLKENEISLLRREKEEAERRREEAERAKEEAQRGQEDAERRREEAERRANEEKRELEARIRQLEQRLDERKSCSSLDGTYVIFSDSDMIKKEGNKIGYTGTRYAITHCIIGGEMRTVCVC